MAIRHDSASANHIGTASSINITIVESFCQIRNSSALTMLANAHSLDVVKHTFVEKSCSRGTGHWCPAARSARSKHLKRRCFLIRRRLSRDGLWEVLNLALSIQLGHQHRALRICHRIYPHLIKAHHVEPVIDPDKILDIRRRPLLQAYRTLRV
jgi:hypothetical protein